MTWWGRSTSLRTLWCLHLMLTTPWLSLLLKKVGDSNSQRAFDRSIMDHHNKMFYKQNLNSTFNSNPFYCFLFWFSSASLASPPSFLIPIRLSPLFFLNLSRGSDPWANQCSAGSGREGSSDGGGDRPWLHWVWILCQLCWTGKPWSEIVGYKWGSTTCANANLSWLG